MKGGFFFMSLYNESVIETIAAALPQFISGKRLAHTLAVERECRALSALFCAHPI